MKLNKCRRLGVLSVSLLQASHECTTPSNLRSCDKYGSVHFHATKSKSPQMPWAVWRKYIHIYEGRSKLLILLQQKMDVIGFESDLIVLQCFEFVAYL